MKNHGEKDLLWERIRLTGELEGRPVRILETTPSTNTLAMEMGKAGAPAGSVIVAEFQNQGRGRLGKTWHSPVGGGLYFSMILKPDLAFEDVPKMTLAAGLAVCKAMEILAGVAPAIKWPNDILLGGRKCGGILAEAEILPSSGNFLVILGVGLNITTPVSLFPSDLQPKVISLLEYSGRFFSRSAVLKGILAELDAVILRLEEGMFPEILAQWRARDAFKGSILSWVSTEGKVVTGVSLGPDDEGILKIREQGGKVHTVLSGDIALAQAL